MVGYHTFTVEGSPLTYMLSICSILIEGPHRRRLGSAMKKRGDHNFTMSVPRSLIGGSQSRQLTLLTQPKKREAKVPRAFSTVAFRYEALFLQALVTCPICRNVNIRGGYWPSLLLSALKQAPSRQTVFATITLSQMHAPPFAPSILALLHLIIMVTRRSLRRPFPQGIPISTQPRLVHARVIAPRGVQQRVRGPAHGVLA